MDVPLLAIRDLSVVYPQTRCRLLSSLNALKKINLQIFAGQTLGIVGESGSGKSTLGKAIVGLVPVTQGEILFKGVDLLKVPKKSFQSYRKKIQMVFQDPFGALNPSMTIEQILLEPLKIHFPHLSKAEHQRRIRGLLNSIKLPETVLKRYPNEFSGGQRQRIGIARALAVEPELLICDEPVSALDVSIQAQIVNLLKDLQKSLHLTYCFISHDMAVVKYISDHVAVMYKGEIIELAPASVIYSNPQNLYTQQLIEAVPTL